MLPDAAHLSLPLDTLTSGSVVVTLSVPGAVSVTFASAGVSRLGAF